MSRRSARESRVAGYRAFLLKVREQTTEHLFIVQGEAKHHISKATQELFEAHQDRMTACQLPSYSPDQNPIEYLWHLVKQGSTHCKYFAEFVELMASVDKALANLA